MNHTDQQRSNVDTHDHDLGRLVFEGKPSIARGVVFVAIGVSFLLLAITLLSQVADPKTPLVAALVGLMSLIFIALGVVYLLPRVGSVFYFHERGLKHVLRGRQRVLRYENVAELSFLTQRIYYSGAHVGSPARLTLRSTDPHEKPFIINQGSRKTTGAPAGDLHRVCFHIARIMAARLAEQVENGQAVAWTDRMRIHADGIEVRDGTIIVCDGKRVPNLVPWNKVARADFANGMFRLLVEGERNFRVVVKADAPNFYPGYLYAAGRMPAEVSALRQMNAEWGDGGSF